MTPEKKVVTFGEIMLRLAAPATERLLQTSRFDATFGGSEANVAIALSIFGVRSSHVTVLPEQNALSDSCIGELRRFGVETDNIVRGAVRDLFANEKDPIQIMKLKEIYELLEQTTDFCEDVADALQNVVVKNS